MLGRLSILVVAFGLMLSAAIAGPRVGAIPELPASLVQQVQMVQAQSGPVGTADQGRCITIRKCQFERGASFRGCISTYTCRVCKLVPARCDIGGRTENCREMRCTWG